MTEHPHKSSNRVPESKETNSEEVSKKPHNTLEEPKIAKEQADNSKLKADHLIELIKAFSSDCA